MRDIVLPEGLCFRAMEPSDENFVYSSFIKNMNSEGMLLSRRITVAKAHDCLRIILQHLLGKAACVLLSDANNLNVICGFVLFEKQQRKVCVHYAYVPEAFRGLGYSSLLWEFATRGLHKDDMVWVSSLSARARNIMDDHRIPYTFKPSMLFSTDTFKQANQQDNNRYAKSQEADSTGCP